MMKRVKKKKGRPQLIAMLLMRQSLVILMTREQVLPSSKRQLFIKTSSPKQLLLLLLKSKPCLQSLDLRENKQCLGRNMDSQLRMCAIQTMKRLWTFTTCRGEPRCPSSPCLPAPSKMENRVMTKKPRLQDSSVSSKKCSHCAPPTDWATTTCAASSRWSRAPVWRLNLNLSNLLSTNLPHHQGQHLLQSHPPSKISVNFPSHLLRGLAVLLSPWKIIKLSKLGLSSTTRSSIST